MVYFCNARIPDYLIRPAVVVAANPFKDEKKSVARTSSESDGSEEEEERFEQEDGLVENSGALRITTRANVPYNLEGYARNAMLIMHMTGYRNAHDGRRHEMIKVANTFANFRFEIQQYEELTPEQTHEKCSEFFQRDFSDYGCVAVVLLRKFRHFIRPLFIRNPTLRGKPKLFIDEMGTPASVVDPPTVWEHNPDSPFYPRDQWLMINDRNDILEIYTHTIFLLSSSTIPPLLMLCDKLTAMPDDHLMEIIKETVRNTTRHYQKTTYVASTLERNLFLPRSNEGENN